MLLSSGAPRMLLVLLGCCSTLVLLECSSRCSSNAPLVLLCGAPRMLPWCSSNAPVLLSCSPHASRCAPRMLLWCSSDAPRLWCSSNAPRLWCSSNAPLAFLGCSSALVLLECSSRCSSRYFLTTVFLNVPPPRRATSVLKGCAPAADPCPKIFERVKGSAGASVKDAARPAANQAALGM